MARLLGIGWLPLVPFANRQIIIFNEAGLNTLGEELKAQGMTF